MSIRKTHNDFVNEVSTKHPNISVLGKYITAREPIEFYCNIHNFSFVITPDSFLRSKYGCPHCAIESVTNNIKKTNDNFIEQLNKVLPTVEPLEKYKTSRDKISVRCSVCNNVWLSAHILY